MKQGMSYTLATATLLALAISAQAEPPRTLVPVADPLDQLQLENFYCNIPVSPI